MATIRFNAHAGAAVTLWLNSVEYQNHSIVYADDIYTSTTLQCRTSIQPCCSSIAGGWYYPSGSAVPTSTSYSVYQIKTTGAVYLYRRTSSLNSVTKGLYRCAIPITGTYGDIRVAYVGVYRQSSSSGKLAIHAPVLPISSRYNCVKLFFGPGTPTISGTLQFTRVDEGIDQPDDSPVFTLTCNSGGSPATAVTWKRDGTVVSEDDNHVMTRRLVGQSGPSYTSTLTVTGREDGLYTCTVTNDIGSANRQDQVEGKGHLHVRNKRS